MKIEFLNNCGVQNLKQQLEEQIKTSTNFNIASAFITAEGVNILQAFLKRRTKGSSRIIVSLYQCFNSQETLYSLKALHTKSKGKILVHLSKNQHFHWKYYSFEKATTTTAFIGSANFTNSGLSGEGELTTKISFSSKDKLAINNLQKLYNTEFENSISIEKFPIELYKSSSSKLNNATEKLHPDLVNLLKENKIEKGDLIPKLAVRISGNLTQATVKLVSKTKSHWDKSQWDYFALQSKREYDKFTVCRYFVIINYYSRRYNFSIHEIKDFTPLKTPDGHYFIAHKQVSKIKRETEKLREQFLSLGISYRSRNFDNYTLSPKKGNILKGFFFSTDPL